MQTPNVVHPTTFEYDGRNYRVVAYCTLTDAQARNAVRNFLRTQKRAKGKRGSTITVVTAFTEANRHLLG